MKTHRIILSITLALGGLLAVASAGMAQDQKAGQDAKKGRQNVEQRLNTMAEELKLTAEQKTKVKALLEDQAKKMEAMRGEMQNLSQEERRAKMQTNREEMNKKMKEILTADQYTKYEAQRAEMRKKGGEGKKQQGEGKKKAN
jgi:Spy/CpxP family protein refolding chaperone